MNAPTLGELLHGFFEDHLKCQKGLRLSSIRSYRDGMSLFLQSVAKQCGRKLSALTISDLTCERVIGFLNGLETERQNHIRTRNQRLAALRTFFEYVVHRMPEGLKEAARIAAIPSKRVPPPETRFLDRDEVQSLFNCLTSSGWAAERDRTLLLFLYNTGARVQEVADLCVKNLELESTPRVHLHGKGDKWRTCPLWKDTAEALTKLLQTNKNYTPESAVFTARSGLPLTRYGIYKLVRRHTRQLCNAPVGQSKRNISPHVFRHTAAAHLLESGVDVNVIRAWLGHVSLETTNRYAEINLRMKQKALEACQPPVGNCLATRPARSVWRDDAELLKWLKAL
jgi:site-specific recombinase XerD